MASRFPFGPSHRAVQLCLLEQASSVLRWVWDRADAHGWVGERPTRLLASEQRHDEMFILWRRCTSSLLHFLEWARFL